MEKDIYLEEYINKLSKNITILDLSFKDLTYIPSLENFTKLKIFDCSYNNLESLPILPNSLEILFCQKNKLKSIVNLPINIKYLDCSYNNIESLPNLSKQLLQLNCSTNNLPYFDLQSYTNYKKIE